MARHDIASSTVVHITVRKLAFTTGCLGVVISVFFLRALGGSVACP
jgi:hypothetical protein